MKENFVVRLILSTLRTILGIECVKLAVLTTRTPEICQLLAEHGIEGDLTTILVFFASMPVTALLGALSLLLISPLFVILLVGVFQQECGIDYRKTKKIFHKMRNLFIW